MSGNSSEATNIPIAVVSFRLPVFGYRKPNRSVQMANKELDMLGMILAAVSPRPKTRAAELYDAFGSLPALLAATANPLSAKRYMSDEERYLLESIQHLILLALQQKFQENPIIGTIPEVESYLRLSASFGTRQVLHILYLDHTNRLIEDEMYFVGSCATVPILYPREVLRKTLALDASAIVIVQTQSNQNPESTILGIRPINNLINILGQFEIVFHDYIVIATNGSVSLRGRGVLNSRIQNDSAHFSSQPRSTPRPRRGGARFGVDRS